MKKMLATLLVVFMHCSVHSQNLNTMTGDWIRIKSEYKDGRETPDGHHSHAMIRYHFTQKEIYQVFYGDTRPSPYIRNGNLLKIEPVLEFVIEEYTDKALTLVEANEPDPIRYYMIPTDSFQLKVGSRYEFEVIGADTIYANGPGLDPIYPNGKNEFIASITTGLIQKSECQVSYVVQKDGTIGDVTVKDSSNPKSDSRVIKLIKKSSGKWIPATYKGKQINVRQTNKISNRGATVIP